MKIYVFYSHILLLHTFLFRFSKTTKMQLLLHSRCDRVNIFFFEFMVSNNERLGGLISWGVSIAKFLAKEKKFEIAQLSYVV